MHHRNNNSSDRAVDREVKMNCFWLFVSVVFVAGAADVSNASKAAEEVDACFDTYGKGTSVCMDTGNLLSCLKKIQPEKGAESDVTGYMKYVEHELSICPGFTTSEKCRDSESLKCKDSFYDKQQLGDKSICDELQDVRDCLTKSLNESCVPEVISEEMRDVNKLDHDCTTGNFNGGPCSITTIQTCGVPVFRDYEITEDVEVIHHCKQRDVDKAEDCLAALTTKCKTKDQQRIIAFEVKSLRKTCPSL